MKNKMFPFGPNISVIYRFLDRLGTSISRQDIRSAYEKLPEQVPFSLLTASQILQAFNLKTCAFKASIESLKNIHPPFLTFYPRRGRKRLILIEYLDSNYVIYYIYNEGVVKEKLRSFAESWNNIALSGKIVGQTAFSCVKKEEENRAIEKYRQKHIKFVPDFFSSEECDELIEYAEGKALFRHSLVSNKGKLESSISRTSYSAFLKDRKDLVLRNVYDRASAFMNEKNIRMEDLQIVRYAEDQEFKPHFDPKKNFDRKFTMLIYLNDDFEGGETYFPEVDLKITPKKGSMLCFRNRDDNHRIAVLSLHAGLPVYDGTKYGCNIWIESHSEEIINC